MKLRPLAIAVFSVLLATPSSLPDSKPAPGLRPLVRHAAPALRPISRRPRLVPLADVLVKPIYEKVCGDSVEGLPIYVPARNADGSYVENDSVYVVTEMIRGYVRQWIGGLLSAGSWSTMSGVCVGIYDDVNPETGLPEPNAFATSDHNILMGIRYVSAMIDDKTGEIDEARFVYVLAHEFGHHLQYLKKLTFNQYATHEVSELQADCISGYILTAAAKKFREHEFYERALESAKAGGDFAIFDLDHHGTPEKRRRATELGVLTAEGHLLAQIVDERDPAKRHMPTVEKILEACSPYPADQQHGNFD